MGVLLDTLVVRNTLLSAAPAAPCCIVGVRLLVSCLGHQNPEIQIYLYLARAPSTRSSCLARDGLAT
jgi:hypothetical protein